MSQKATTSTSHHRQLNTLSYSRPERHHITVSGPREITDSMIDEDWYTKLVRKLESFEQRRRCTENLSTVLTRVYKPFYSIWYIFQLSIYKLG